MSPYSWRDVFADLAFVFHWSLSDLERTDWSELVAFHERAIARWNAANNCPPKDSK